jgi:hypothetical protein
MGVVVSLEDVASERFMRRACDVWAAGVVLLLWPTPAALFVFWSHVDRWEGDRIRLDLTRRAAA